MLRSTFARCSCVAFAAFIIQPVQAALRYRLTLLQQTPMSVSTHATSISANGHIAGQTNSPGGTDPISVFWSDSASLPIVACDQFCQTGGVNSDGRVVGIAGEGAAAFQWTQERGLSLLPDFTFCCAKAMAVNDVGVIVGEGYFSGFGFPQASRWINNQIDHLSPLDGQLGGIAMDINAQGDIVGSSGSQAALWSAGQVVDLGSPGANHVALGINDVIDIVGSYTTPPTEPFHIKPFLWRSGVLTTLPTASGSGEARSINNEGLIVGWATTLAGGAVIWRNEELIPLALRTVNLPANAALQNASDINSVGQIVGSGTFGGQSRAFIADPIPPADVVIDGSVNVDDLIAIILAWGPCPADELCHADVIEDSVVDVDDLIAVILAWST